MHDMVWLVWDGQALLGVFAVQGDAERRASQARAVRGVEREDDPQGWSVRVEPWSIAAPSGQPPSQKAGAQHRAVLERVDREWGLLEIPAMGTAHLFHLDTYLVVPYRNRLVCPAFQFDLWRELWPGFRDVLQVLRDADWDDVSITAWFVSRQGSADGDVPALLIRDDPARVLGRCTPQRGRHVSDGATRPTSIMCPPRTPILGPMTPRPLRSGDDPTRRRRIVLPSLICRYVLVSPAGTCGSGN